MKLHIVSSATVLSAVGVLLTLLGGTRRRPAQVLIALGVVCVLAAFCLDAGAGEIQGPGLCVMRRTDPASVPAAFFN